MQTINKYIQERLILSKNKKEEDIEFSPFDTTYEGKIQLSNISNKKLEFHKIYNDYIAPIAWTETWIEGIKDSYTTLIVPDDVYDYLLRFVSDYDSDWGFGIIDNNERLYKQLHGLLDEFDNLYLASFEKWYESRESIFKKETQAMYGAFTIIAEKIENTLIK